MSDLDVAGQLIVELRQHAHLTQTALAQRAGVPRSVLSAYERGHRQPSVAMLARLARAAGLKVGVVPPVDVARNAARFVDALTLVDAASWSSRPDPLALPLAWRA